MPQRGKGVAGKWSIEVIRVRTNDDNQMGAVELLLEGWSRYEVLGCEGDSNIFEKGTTSGRGGRGARKSEFSRVILSRLAFRTTNSAFSFLILNTP